VPTLTPTDCPQPGIREAIFAAVDTSVQPVIGPTMARLLVIPIHDDSGAVAGGFWGSTLFEWLQVELLFVPEALRRRGVGAALIGLAEREARGRGCRGAMVSTFSFQATGFYRALGYAEFSVLPDFPPGHSMISMCKRL